MASSTTQKRTLPHHLDYKHQ